MVLGVFLWVLVFVSACSRTQYKYHVVRSGETLSEIGYAYRIPYQELAALNNIRDPNQIQSGANIDMTQKGILQAARELVTTTLDVDPDEFYPTGFAVCRRRTLRFGSQHRILPLWRRCSDPPRRV